MEQAIRSTEIRSTALTAGRAGVLTGEVIGAELATIAPAALPLRSDSLRQSSGQAGQAIVARVDVRIRPGTLADVPFIDGLQKQHSRELGFLPTMAIEGKLKLGEVLIAEVGNAAVGYLIAADRYFKRDEVGYVTQINVRPEFRRSLVAAALLQAQFDRSAYGCRLYSCWCAQDLKANEFWEAMGFVPIAFRTGSRTKGKDASGKSMPRMHLFWQKRIRPSDDATPWWYPSHTGGGELREDRLVFPIPPGMHWRDVLPIVLSPVEGPVVLPNEVTEGGEVKAIEASVETPKPRVKKAKAAPPVLVAPRGRSHTLWFAEEATVVEPFVVEKPVKVKKKPAPIDPRLKRLAREMRDVWAEQSVHLLPSATKHDVRKLTTTTAAMEAIAPPKALLAA